MDYSDPDRLVWQIFQKKIPRKAKSALNEALYDYLPLLVRNLAQFWVKIHIV